MLDKLKEEIQIHRNLQFILNYQYQEHLRKRVVNQKNQLGDGIMLIIKSINVKI